MGDSSLAVSESLEPSRPTVGSRDADAQIRRLITEHGDFVWRVLRRMGVPTSSAEDAAQNVFIVVAKKTRDFWPQNEKSYLFAIAIRVAAGIRRAEHQAKEQLSEQDWSKIADATPGPDETLDDCRARAALDKILDSMPFDQRVVFVLFELEDMTTQEISEILDVPMGTVASRLRRARETFQQAVRRHKTRSLK